VVNGGAAQWRPDDRTVHAVAQATEGGLWLELLAGGEELIGRVAACELDVGVAPALSRRRDEVRAHRQRLAPLVVMADDALPVLADTAQLCELLIAERRDRRRRIEAVLELAVRRSRRFGRLGRCSPRRRRTSPG
jgi:hypothetical protein